ncbi:MAG TPA: rhomboid family intramembrane serine protease [Tepidisphaeraceae bacterium]|nr:rhomboid family intramembrane serine protease [Tepidisphaeraceae bacterium]
MRLLTKLEQRLEPYAVPNVTLYVVFLQGLAYVLSLARPQRPDALEPSGFLGQIALIPAKVAAGEWWRLFTYVFDPPASHPLWLLIGLMFFYWIGTSLEREWGAVRYNLYLLLGYVVTTAAAMLTLALPFTDPTQAATTAFLGGSVFLAFAFLYPDMVIRLYFVFPVKVKYLGFVAAAFTLFAILRGDNTTRLLTLASVVNFLVFFGGDLFAFARGQRQRMKQRIRRDAAKPADVDEPFHRCTTCGVTDKSNTRMEFRYCDKCAGTPCYCIEHIGNHAHR